MCQIHELSADSESNMFHQKTDGGYEPLRKDHERAYIQVYARLIRKNY